MPRSTPTFQPPRPRRGARPCREVIASPHGARATLAREDGAGFTAGSEDDARTTLPCAGGAPVTLAREDGAGYDIGPDGDPAPEPPFGLPLLAEAPELAGLLEGLREVDRMLARALRALILVQDVRLAEEVTGVGLDQWLARIGRRTGADRRMLTIAAATCRRLPLLLDALADGRISWCQLRAVALKTHRLPSHHDARIEAELAAAIDATTPEDDPDALTDVVSWVLADLAADERDREPVREPDFLQLAPRRDGSGGTLFGDFGPERFAQVEAVLNAGLRPDATTRVRLGASDEEARRSAGRSLAQRRAERLVHLLGRAVHPGRAGASVPHGPHEAEERTAAPGPHTAGPGPHADEREGCHEPAIDAKLLLRAELQDLLQLAERRGGGQLLTHLSGGHLRLDAATARRLADHATSLRLIITDHGRVVGIGRRRQAVPGWLRDAVLAVHDTCTAPGCTVAARVCDIDHARPFGRGGRTDIDNLAPLCSGDNHRKEPEGWQVRQEPDHRRTWHHRRSGLRARTTPATWVPPGRRRGPGAPASPDGRPGTPGTEGPPDTWSGDGPPSTRGNGSSGARGDDTRADDRTRDGPGREPSSDPPAAPRGEASSDPPDTSGDDDLPF